MKPTLLLLLAVLAVAGCDSPPATGRAVPGTARPVPPPSPLLTELPAAGWAVPTGTPTPAASLPLAWRCACPTDPPAPPAEPAIVDCAGQIAGSAWLTATFGAVTWHQAAGARVATLRAACGDAPAVIVAHVADAGSGAPRSGATVVLTWPDAPLLPPELRACGLTRGVYGPTNAAGDVGFGLGGGAYYTPPAAGPHSLYIPAGDDSACLHGLGMLAGTNHQHLDAGWTLRLERDADAVALWDWGYTPGTLVYSETIAGRPLHVIQWPSR